MRTAVKEVLAVAALALALGAVACGGIGGNASNPGSVGPSTGSPSSSAASPLSWDLRPFVLPTLPAEIPGYAGVDPATGLHVNGTAQVIDLRHYRLKVGGNVATPLSLSYAELLILPKITSTPTLTCPGFFEDVTTWSGVPLKTILELAGIQPDAERVALIGADGYSAAVDVEEAIMPENYLAYEWMGEPLPVLHGFPLRAVFPEQFGSRWVKWLVEIVVE